MAIATDNTTPAFRLLEFLSLLAKYGCRFIPLHAFDKLPIEHWQDKSGDLSPQEAAARVRSGLNIAVVPGDRLVLVDTDTAEAQAKFQKAFPGVQPTLKTPRGFHYWLLCPEGETIAGLGITQVAGKTTLGPGLDTRTPGRGYAVGPGAVVDERAYKDKTPPPGKAPWHYELIGGVSEVSAEALAVLRKPPPSAKTTPGPGPAQAKAKAKAKAAPRKGGKVAPLATPGLSIAPGTRNDAINRLAYSLALQYPRVSPAALRAEMEAVREQCIAPGGDPYTDAEFEATLKSAFDAAAKKSAETDPHLSAEKQLGAFHDPSGNPVDDFHRQITALGVEVCFNVRARRHEFIWPGEAWQDERDQFDKLRTRLELLSPPRPKLSGGDGPQWDFSAGRGLEKNKFDDFISAAGASNHRDHWMEELKALRHERAGKGKADAALLLEFSPTWYHIPEDYGKLPAQWAIANTLIGAIKRAWFPGAKHDLTTLLISTKQGLVKSSIFRVLLGPHLFTSGVRLTGIKDPLRAFEQTAGVAIAEIADLRGLRGAASEEALPALSETHSAPVREAYGKKGEAKAKPYRHVWLVTTNRMNCIATLNGENRRLFPTVLDDLRDDPNLNSLPKALQDKLSGMEDPAERLLTALADPEYQAALLHGALFLALDGAKDPEGGDFSGSRYEQMYKELELCARNLTERHQYHDDIHEGIINKWAQHEQEKNPDWQGGEVSDCIAFMHQEKSMPGNEHYADLLRLPKPLQGDLTRTLERVWGPASQPRIDGRRPRIFRPKQ